LKKDSKQQIMEALTELAETRIYEVVGLKTR
jgi:hypothetical protein